MPRSGPTLGTRSRLEPPTAAVVDREPDGGGAVRGGTSVATPPSRSAHVTATDGRESDSEQGGGENHERGHRHPVHRLGRNRRDVFER